MIIDDTAKVKTGRKVDLISWFRDHCNNTFYKGFQNLTMVWTNGRTVIPLEFEMKTGKKKAGGKNKSRNYAKGTHTEQRIRFSKAKKTTIAIQMIKRAIQRKFEFKYILWDSWFNCNETLTFIFSMLVPQGYTLVSMVKRSKQKYRYNGKDFTISELFQRAGNYSKNKETGIRSKSIIVEILDTKSNSKISKRVPLGKAMICFYKYPKVKRYRAILSTDVCLSEDQVLKVYLKRWSVECFFKDIKQHFGYSQSKSSRYSGMIGDLTIRYVFYILFSYHKEKENKIVESKLKTTELILIDFYKDLYDIWLSEFIELMFKRIVSSFLEKTLKMGDKKISKVLEDLDHILEVFFKSACYIDKIVEVNNCANP